MHHNDLKCGEIVDNFCYIPSHFVQLKTGWGGAMLASFGPLVQNMG